MTSPTVCHICDNANPLATSNGLRKNVYLFPANQIQRKCRSRLKMLFSDRGPARCFESFVENHRSRKRYIRFVGLGYTARQT